MRDRTLPMKWVAEMAEAGKTDEEIRQEFVRREIKESTITDQLRKLQKHNIGGRKLVDHAKNDVVVQTGKPFRPVPKDGKKKRREPAKLHRHRTGSSGARRSSSTA